MCNLKWSCVKVAVVVNVIAESEVAMCENGSGGQWVCKLKWPCGKVEVVVKVSAESKVAMCESGSDGQCGCVI